MSRDYFYFISGLPNIAFEDSKQAISPEKFREEAKAQLDGGDYSLLKILHLVEDLDLLLAVLYKLQRDPSLEALFTMDYWAEFVSHRRSFTDNPRLECPPEYQYLPGFVAEIVDKLLLQEEIQSYNTTELELLAGFYRWAEEHPNVFIRKWFSHEVHLRNILVAINGRKYELSYAQYLVGDNETVQLLAKSHAADFGLGKDDPLFENLIRIYEQNNILFREKNYDILRWKWIENQNFFNYFNIYRILGYYCKIRILHRWLKTDPNYGREVFQDTLDKLENSFSFPPEFSIKNVRK